MKDSFKLLYKLREFWDDKVVLEGLANDNDVVMATSKHNERGLLRVCQSNYMISSSLSYSYKLGTLGSSEMFLTPSN